MLGACNFTMFVKICAKILHRLAYPRYSVFKIHITICIFNNVNRKKLMINILN